MPSTPIVPSSDATESHLAGAARIRSEHPGSMVRAELAFRVACSLGARRGRAENLAIAIEYFHTASLLFDDLPSMDDARLRRGKSRALTTFMAKERRFWPRWRLSIARMR